MAILPILTYPHPTLRQKAAPVPVDEITPEIRQLIADMFETMRFEDRGIGLAANQVGVLKRIIVIDLEEEDKNSPPLVLINPEIVWRSDTPQTMDEGCLSVPGQYAPVTRPDQVKITYMNENGDRCEYAGQGLMSSCLQHEIDHIDGILYPERISPIKRKILYAKALKAAKVEARKRS